MSILDDVMMNAKSVAVSVSKKAGKIVDLSKLKLSAAEIESDISKKFQTLGKVVYNATKDSSLSGGIDALIAEINDLYLQLDAVNEQINTMRNKKACSQCKKVNDAESVYCSFCGALLPVAEKEEPVCEEACEAAEPETVCEEAQEETAQASEENTEA